MNPENFYGNREVGIGLRIEMDHQDFYILYYIKSL